MRVPKHVDLVVHHPAKIEASDEPQAGGADPAKPKRDFVSEYDAGKHCDEGYDQMGCREDSVVADPSKNEG